MRTQNSIDLVKTEQTCGSEGGDGACKILPHQHRSCGSYKCPFYKPEGCKDWVRVEDEDGINLIPPEEYTAARKRKKKTLGVATWKISCRRA